MSDQSKIEWTDATWNPVRGCSRVSEGCRNCYAETVAKRFSGPGMPYEGLIASGGQWNGKIKQVYKNMDQPLRWRTSRRIFVNSMSDLFHESVEDSFIWELFAVMTLANWHTFQILTKRPERMRDFMQQFESMPDYLNDVAMGIMELDDMEHAMAPEHPAQNIWLGVSVEDQTTADERIPFLLETPAAVRWVSAEPLLGSINLQNYFEQWPDHNGVRVVQNGNGIDWVVVGGESGPYARPMHPLWAQSLRDQCSIAGVPFLFKQWGEFADLTKEKDGSDLLRKSRQDHIFTPGGKIVGAGYRDGKTTMGLVEPDWREQGAVWMGRIGKKAAGRLLDGKLHDEYPGEAA